MSTAARRESQRLYDRTRANNPARALYGTAQWQKLRKAKLTANPLCECDFCTAHKRVTPATVVDHKIPHKGDRGLFFDYSNLQSLGKNCHDSKTAREDGGFGRVKPSRKGGCDLDGNPLRPNKHW